MTTDRLPDGVEVDRRAHPRGLFGRFKTWLFRTRNIRNLEAVLGTIALAGGVVLTLYLVDAESDERRREGLAAIEYESELNAYQAEVRAYDRAMADRALCLDGVTRSDNNRRQWQQLADIVQALGTPNAVVLADQIRLGPVLAAEPREATDCPELPPLPIPPARINP